MLSPASSCLSVCLSVGWMDDLLLWSSGSCADTLLGRQLTENNNNNKLAPAEMLCVCVKAAQTICANAPVLSTGWSFAFLLRLYSASPPLLVPHSHSLSLSFSLSLLHTHTRTRAHSDTYTHREAIGLSGRQDSRVILSEYFSIDPIVCEPDAGPLFFDTVAVPGCRWSSECTCGNINIRSQ